MCGEKKCTVIGLYVEEKNYPISVEILKGGGGKNGLMVVNNYKTY